MGRKKIPANKAIVKTVRWCIYLKQRFVKKKKEEEEEEKEGKNEYRL